MNEIIAVLLEDGEDAGAIDGFLANDNGAPATAPTATEEAASAPASTEAPTTAPAARSASSGDRVFASPLAKRIAKDKGIDLARLKAPAARTYRQGGCADAQPGAAHAARHERSSHSTCCEASATGPDAKLWRICWAWSMRKSRTTTSRRSRRSA